MEKYSRWRDAGTGIHPFIPPKPPRTNESAIKTVSTVLKYYVVGPPVALVKLVLELVLGLAYLILNSAGTLLILPPLRRAWDRLISVVFLRTILLLMGFWWIRTEKSSLRKGYVVSMIEEPGYNPTFVEVSLDGNVRTCSMWSALSRVGNASAPSETKGWTTLADVAESCRKGSLGPVVVFPEGTTSNGRGLLRFLPVFKNIDFAKHRIHIVAFRYDYEDFSPSFTVGSKFAHLFGLNQQIFNTLEVKLLPSHEVIPEESQSSSAAADPTSPHLSTLMSNTTRLRRTGLGAQDKLDFLEYYREREQKKRYRK
ncbi:hypothetical protein HK102_001297 [Quaeritorhiza haematococci]|nr:hypothetical protein HK102_001297 [Quaeritorhiza haematococci]